MHENYLVYNYDLYLWVIIALKEKKVVYLAGFKVKHYVIAFRNSELIHCS